VLPAALPSLVDDTSPADFIDIKTYIDGALTLLREMPTMVEKMATTEETRTTPLACCAVFKRKRLTNPTYFHHQEGQSSALTRALELTTHEREGCDAGQLHYQAEFNTALLLGVPTQKVGQIGTTIVCTPLGETTTLPLEKGTPHLEALLMVPSSLCVPRFFHGVGGGVATMVVEACSW
jgi:hypothetical protein